ncbi:hypothetical protein PVAND_002809 [Polypedilum vanderplanki]|uniref:Coiled-coil domain-containing protein n=1 Tax=Polypedilum vanderplanki TaxID=319348 RepID=A0A9J6BS53_POLVA|nr:hypothetical protein PVAND_002809 [Polypedilum vanderplanki]
MSEEKKNKIEIDQSSLLSLKTELLRKKAEALSSNQQSTVTKFKIKHDKTKKIDTTKSEKDCKVYEHEDKNQMDKVKKTLEAKAKYYEKMQSSRQNTALILFKNKVSTKESNAFDDEDYVEFTDCFGRSRHLSKEEYNTMKRQQIEETGDRIEKIVKVEQEVGNHFRKQREHWENQEKINSEQNEVFYQDLLFDEAREHGTSFYAFSTDHAKREEQKEKLLQMRKDTEKAQSQRNLLKRQRDEIIKNRVTQAKARIRQKFGLPPETTAEETTEEQYKDNLNEAHTEKIDEMELERERQRKEHIRPWDKDKLSEKRKNEYDETEWIPKREKLIMTQEEWIDKQRNERDKNFAPMYDSKPSSSSQMHHHRNSSNKIEKDVLANLKFIRKKFD